MNRGILCGKRKLSNRLAHVSHYCKVTKSLVQGYKEITIFSYSFLKFFVGEELLPHDMLKSCADLI